MWWLHPTKAWFRTIEWKTKIFSDFLITVKYPSLVHLQDIRSVPLTVRQRVSKCAPPSTTTSGAPVCQDSNYRVTNEAASPKVWFTNIPIFTHSFRRAKQPAALPSVEFPCGSLPETSNRSASLCVHGNCPWQVRSVPDGLKTARMFWASWLLQVSVVNSRGVEVCGGVLLAQSAVLTAASCLPHLEDVQPQNLHVVPGTELHLLLFSPIPKVPVSSSFLPHCFYRSRQWEAVYTRDLCEPPQSFPQRRPRPRPRLPRPGTASKV